MPWGFAPPRGALARPGQMPVGARGLLLSSGTARDEAAGAAAGRPASGVHAGRAQAVASARPRAASAPPPGAFQLSNGQWVSVGGPSAPAAQAAPPSAGYALQVQGASSAASGGFDASGSLSGPGRRTSSGCSSSTSFPARCGSGDFSEGARIHREMLEVLRLRRDTRGRWWRVLGLGHPSTLASANRLGCISGSAVTAAQWALGAEYPKTLAACVILAACARGRRSSRSSRSSTQGRSGCGGAYSGRAPDYSGRNEWPRMRPRTAGGEHSEALLVLRDGVMAAQRALSTRTRRR